MDEPSRLSKAFALPGGCRKDQGVEAQLSCAEPVAQTVKEIGRSSSKKWWFSPIYLCVMWAVWAWRTEPWQRKCRCGAEGLEKCQQRWQGEVGGCDPLGSLLPWHSCRGPGGYRGKRGFPVSPAKAKGLFVSNRG